jgi:hypothetical protein
MMFAEPMLRAAATILAAPPGPPPAPVLPSYASLDPPARQILAWSFVLITLVALAVFAAAATRLWHRHRRGRGVCLDSTTFHVAAISLGMVVCQPVAWHLITTG